MKLVAPDTRFRTYLKAFFSDMLTGMSGPLSVPVALLALYVSNRSLKILFGCLAVLCAMFASYRVWQKERRDATTQLSVKEIELVELRERLDSLDRKSTFKMRMSVEGTPPSQIVTLVADRRVMVLRLEYMLSDETCIASEDVSIEGDTIDLSIKDDSLSMLWNTTRHDASHSDSSGPAKIGVMIVVDGETQHFILPVHMRITVQNATYYVKLVGSKVF